MNERMLVGCDWCEWTGTETDDSREDLTPMERHLRTVHAEQIIFESAAADAANRAALRRYDAQIDDQHRRGVLIYASHITAGLPCCAYTPQESHS
jgi:hypothetical protein